MIEAAHQKEQDQSAQDGQNDPGGMKRCPSAGLENSRAINPPTIEPPMPTRAVIKKPRCCAPGLIARAMRPMMRPMMKPTMMDQMMCNMGFVGGAYPMCSRHAILF